MQTPNNVVNQGVNMHQNAYNLVSTPGHLGLRDPLNVAVSTGVKRRKVVNDYESNVIEQQSRQSYSPRESRRDLAGKFLYLEQSCFDKRQWEHQKVDLTMIHKVVEAFYLINSCLVKVGFKWLIGYCDIRGLNWKDNYLLDKIKFDDNFADLFFYCKFASSYKWILNTQRNVIRVKLNHGLVHNGYFIASKTHAFEYLKVISSLLQWFIGRGIRMTENKALQSDYYNGASSEQDHGDITSDLEIYQRYLNSVKDFIEHFLVTK